MRKLMVFNSVTIDGYFTDKNGDMSWAHKQDPEWNDFVANNAKSGGGELAMPADVRKAFGLPESAFTNLAAVPQFSGRSPNRGRLDGSAERFRTSDGGAAALRPKFLRQIM